MQTWRPEAPGNMPGAGDLTCLRARRGSFQSWGRSRETPRPVGACLSPAGTGQAAASFPQSPGPGPPLVAALGPSQLPYSRVHLRHWGPHVPSLLPPELTTQHPSGVSLGSPPGARCPPLTLQRGLGPFTSSHRQLTAVTRVTMGFFSTRVLLMLQHSETPRSLS